MSTLKKMENQLSNLPLASNFGLSYEKASWLNLKGSGIKDLAKRFEANTRTAVILGDRQLGAKPLVMTRLENYEKLLKTVRDLSNGEAFVRNSMEALSEQISVINDLVEKNDSPIDQTLVKAIRVITKLNISITSVIEPYSQKATLRPRKTTEDDLDL